MESNSLKLLSPESDEEYLSVSGVMRPTDDVVDPLLILVLVGHDQTFLAARFHGRLATLPLDTPDCRLFEMRD